MQVESLSISRRPSYDDNFPNQLVGTVKLKGTNGAQEILLTNAGLSKIFQVISEEVQETARANASAVGTGMSNAMHEPLMMKARNIEVLE